MVMKINIDSFIVKPWSKSMPLSQQTKKQKKAPQKGNKMKYFRLRLFDEVGTEILERDLRLN